jgi:hypothetical protein
MSAYSTEEHIALLHIVCDDPDAFNARKSLSDWKWLQQNMCKTFYLRWGALYMGTWLKCMVPSRK